MASLYEWGGHASEGITGNTKLDRCLRRHKAKRKRRGRR